MAVVYVDPLHGHRIHDDRATRDPEEIRQIIAKVSRAIYNAELKKRQDAKRAELVKAKEN